MRFLAISDTHGKHKALDLPPTDVLIHAGDISMKGSEQEVQSFLSWFSQQDAAYKIFIPGNHDFYLERTTAQSIRAIIPENVIYLNDGMVKLDNITIWGSPVTPWFYNWAFNRHRGEAIKKHWDLIPAGIDIIVTHGPVYGILDKTTGGQHAGCKDLLNALLAVKPKMHICGHIHEAYGNVNRFDINFINASVVDKNYTIKNQPVFFEI